MVRPFCYHLNCRIITFLSVGLLSHSSATISRSLSATNTNLFFRELKSLPYEQNTFYLQIRCTVKWSFRQRLAWNSCHTVKVSGQTTTSRHWWPDSCTLVNWLLDVGDQPHTNYNQPHTDRLYRQHADHIPTIYRPHTDNIPTIYQPHTGHILTTYQLYSKHVPTTVTDHIDHIWMRSTCSL